MRKSLAVACSLAASLVLGNGRAQRPGYKDTPQLPGQAFRVHDADRPAPAWVDPGPFAGSQPPPADAIVLFDGTNLDSFTGRGGKARWQLLDGAMVVNGTGDIRTRAEFGDCQLHVEWMTPAEVAGDSQDRGNSGLFLLDRYEIQVLDSFENPTYADGQAAALYGQFPPMVNASRRPGEWQSYDIVFVAPRFHDDGQLLSPARVTVFHNGILVHLDRALLGATAHRSLPSYKAHARKGPIRLQDHGNPVRFRNFWVRELALDAASEK